MTTNLAVVNELDKLKVQCLKFRFDNFKVANDIDQGHVFLRREATGFLKQKMLTF